MTGMVRRAGHVAAGLLWLAASPVAAQPGPACTMLGAALEAGAFPAALDAERGAGAAVAARDERECTYYVGKAAVAGLDLVDAAALRDPAVCEQLVEIALAGVMAPGWRARYDEIVDRVAEGELRVCAGFFRDYGAEVLDGRGPLCTRAELVAKAGMAESFGTAMEAAQTGDESFCAKVLEAQISGAAPLTGEDAVSEAPVPTGMCEAIGTAVSEGALRPDWQDRADELRRIAEAGDQAACRQVLADYGNDAPGGRLGPYCARAALALAAGPRAQADILAAAIEVGEEVGCREVVRMQAGARADGQ